MAKQLTTAYGDISYRDTGTEQQAIFFVHGNSSCKEVFEKQFGNSLAQQYRLVAIDLPGHGLSFRAEDPQEAYTIHHFAQLVREVCGLLALNNPVLVGWSMGGHIAIEALAQGLDAKALLICGTPPFGPGSEGADSAFYPSEHMALTGKVQFSEEDSIAYASATLGGEQFVSQHLLEQVIHCDGRARATMLNDWGNSSNGHPAIPFVASWPHPIAVVHGKQDPFVQLSHLQNLTWNKLWRNEVHVIPDCGHAPFHEAPDRFNSLLLDFMHSVSG